MDILLSVHPTGMVFAVNPCHVSFTFVHRASAGYKPMDWLLLVPSSLLSQLITVIRLAFCFSLSLFSVFFFSFLSFSFSSPFVFPFVEMSLHSGHNVSSASRSAFPVDKVVRHPQDLVTTPESASVPAKVLSSKELD